MRSSSAEDEGNASRRHYEQPVGLIGLGLMGTALAERLRSGGLDVWGYDIDASREDFLRRIGGKSASSAGGVFAAGTLAVWFGGDLAKVGAVMSLIYALGMVAIWWAPETSKQDLPD